MVNSGVSTLINKSTETTGAKNYTVETSGNLANIKKEAASNGVLYTVQEGDLLNQILITPSQDIYLDGKLVTISTISQTASRAAITPMAYYESWDFDDTAFAPGPYTSNKMTTKTTVALGRKISQVSLSGVALIVCTAFGGPASGATAAAFTYSGLDEIYSWLDAYNPDASSLYIKKTTWSNGNPDLGSSTLKYYFKIKTEYYKDSKYKEYHSGGTLYGVQSIRNH